MRLLNSVDYGAPQQRNRVIFWAAKVGLDLPEWPIPTHVPRGRYHYGPRYIKFAGEERRIPVASRNPFEEEGETERRAPFFAVTVEEAISDLVRPLFLFNPCRLIVCLILSVRGTGESNTRLQKLCSK